VEDALQRQFAWRSRRGLLELDILLQQFVEHDFHSMDAVECKVFERLLAYSDQELLELLMGRTHARDSGEQQLLQKIIQTYQA